MGNGCSRSTPMINVIITPRAKMFRISKGHIFKQQFIIKHCTNVVLIRENSKSEWLTFNVNGNLVVVTGTPPEIGVYPFTIIGESNNPNTIANSQKYILIVNSELDT